MEVISRKLNDIRSRWAFRADADEEGENEEPKKKKHSAFSTRLPYALCKEVGINTEGMTPREAWDAYAGKTGESPKAVKEEKMGDSEPKSETEKGHTVDTEKPLKKTVASKEDAIKKAEEADKAADQFQSEWDKENAPYFVSTLSYALRQGDFEKLFGDDPKHDEYKATAEKYDELVKAAREAQFEADHYRETEPTTETGKKLMDVERARAELKWIGSDYGYYGKEAAEKRKEIEDALKGVANSFVKEGFKTEPFDYENADTVESNKRYGYLGSLEDSLGYLDSDEDRRKARDVIDVEKERAKESFKRDLKNKHKGEYDADDIAVDNLESLSDSELKKNAERLVTIKNSIGDFYKKATIDDDVDVSLAADVWRELDDDVSKKLNHVRTEIEVRKDKGFNEKWKNIGESKETSPTYTKPVLTEYSSKVPKPKVTTGIKTLTDWQKSADAYMNNRAYDEDGDRKGTIWNLNSDEMVKARENLQNIFNNSELCLNINSDKVDKVLLGHLKNQFESGTTDGSSDLNARRNMSHNIFGTPSGTKKEDREKYGYMADKEDYDGTVGAGGPHYGKSGTGSRCCFIFKKDRVQDRTSYTFGDSLAASFDSEHNYYAAGMVDTNCSIEGVSYGIEHAKGLSDGTIKTVRDMFENNRWNYLECQYHGGVTAADIDNVRFRNYHDMKNAIKSWDSRALEIADQNGVRFSYYDQIEKKFVYLSAKEAMESASKLY